MARHAWLLSGLLAGASSACCAFGFGCSGGGSASPAPGDDTGAAPTDTGGGDDTSVAPTDTGGGDDTSVAPTDTGGAPTDTGAPPIDAGPSAVPTIGPCKIFPADNPWNRDVSGDPLSAHNADYLAHMATGTALHPDWGNWSTDHYGIPWQSGTGAAPVAFQWTVSWGNTDSDKLACSTSQYCYPIPTTAKIEGGAGAKTTADRHVLYVDTAGAPDNCTLYEIYNAQNFSSAPWKAMNGAIFHLGSNTLRPDGWTSADAAGLPILPGLVRYDEVAAGAIKHAIRFTMNATANYFIHPATHGASSNGLYYPPMGLRLRLKASKDIGAASKEGQVIFAAMKKYGLILADNGSDWYVSGDSDDRWNTIMDTLVTKDFPMLKGSDFEVVETGTPVVQPP